MSITSSSSVLFGTTTVVTVVSSLTGIVYYHWYLDGTYAGKTTTPQKTFVITAGEQARIACLDTNDPAFDPIANAPAGYPSRRTLLFIRSLDANIARYRIEQQKGSGAWVAIGVIQDDPKKWSYSIITPQLDDLSNYAWRVVPINASGDDGTAITLASELIVRSPDAPDFTVAFDPATRKVTLAAA